VIGKDDLDKALLAASPLFSRLEELYGLLPETRCTCGQPGVCCAFLPEMTLIEMLRWWEVLRSMSAPRSESMLRRFAKFYFSNPVRITGCPFLENGSCSIYPYRTFGCRAYGLWSGTLGSQRTDRSRKEKETLRGMWKQWGIELPPDVVEFEPDYCLDVKTAPGTDVSDRLLMDLLGRVYDLDRGMEDLQSRFESEYHSDVSYLWTCLTFGVRKTLLTKMGIAKELCEAGTEIRLEKALGMVSLERLQ